MTVVPESIPWRRYYGPASGRISLRQPIVNASDNAAKIARIDESLRGLVDDLMVAESRESAICPDFVRSSGDSGQ